MNCAIITSGDELRLSFNNENEPPISALKEQLELYIQTLFIMGYDSFYVDCDYGIPLWAAEIICEMKKKKPVKLHIIMPYEEQASKWSEDIRDRYFAVHEQCDSVKMASTRYQAGCYVKAEDMMLKECDRVLFCKKRDNDLLPLYLDEYDIGRSFFDF